MNDERLPQGWTGEAKVWRIGVSDLRESLEYWEGLMHVDSMPEGKFEPKPLAPIVAAARRFLALTETGPDYEAAAKVACDGFKGPQHWREHLDDVRPIVDAALADYLTEDE